jgi:hypothetical protein
MLADPDDGWDKESLVNDSPQTGLSERGKQGRVTQYYQGPSQLGPDHRKTS